MSARPASVRVAALAGGLLLASPAFADAGMAVSQTYRLSPHVAPGETYMGIRLLGTVELVARRVDGLALGGLSGLAWDEDESRLYALSDKGAVFHLHPHIEAGILSRVDALAAYPLRDRDGRPLKGRHADAEGLAAQGADNGTRGDSVLVASFERFPRILRLRPDGRFVDSLQLPEALGDISRYAHPNRALESVTWFPRRGYLTAPERPLADDRDGRVAIFALNGGRWRYPLAPTPNASLVALEALPDGSLLALERGHGLMFLPMVITLRHTDIDWSAPGSLLAVTTLAVLDTSQAWSVDNLEGLTRHRGLKFFMVSDDNFNDLQKTLLVYFELAGTGDPATRSNVPEFELRQKTSD